MARECGAGFLSDGAGSGSGARAAPSEAMKAIVAAHLEIQFRNDAIGDGHAAAAHARHARQRPRRPRARGSRLPDRRGEPLVSRRIEEREAGPHRLRAPVRAPDVRRVASITTAGTSSRCRKPARTLNGSTNADRTNYWEVVPTNALELALWMESDRMGYLLPALTDAKFENQRDVVLNERRQNYENRPYGLAGDGDAGGAVSAGPSVSLADDRRGRRSARRASSTSAGVLPDATTTRQRVARARRRHRHGRGARARRALLRRSIRATRRRRWMRRDPSRPRARCGCCSRIASSCRASTSRGTRRRCSRPATRSSIWSPTSWPTARRRGSIGAGLRAAHRHRDRRVAELARDRRLLPDRRDRGARPHAAGARSARSPTRSTPFAGDRADGRRNGARPRAGRSAVHLPAADGRRLRRQVAIS